MKRVNKIFFSFLFALIPAFSYASSSDGTAAVPFLKYGAGARAAGMGSAFSAVTGAGSDMIYWNPAGLASIDRQDFSLMYLSGIESISYGWASYAVPTIYGSFGFAAQYMSSGDIDGRGLSAESRPAFSTYDLALSASYAKYYDFGKAGILDYGGSVKYIYSKIDNSASAFAVDAGAIFTLSDAVTSFGLVLQNAGTSLKYNEENEPLPFVIRIGAAKTFMKNLLVTFDLNFPNDNDLFPSFGAQYSLNIMQDAEMALRAGYDGRQKDIDGFSSLNAGFGLKYRDYIFDYAFSPYGNLGSAHRVSVGIFLGKEFNETDALKKIEEKKREREKRKKAEQEAEEERLRLENAAMRPAGLEEDFGADGYGHENLPEEFAPDQDADGGQTNPARNLLYVAVTDFVSADIKENERVLYSEMLRKRLFDSGAFVSADASKVKNIYSANAYPSNGDLYNIFKFAKVKKVIAGEISKKGGSLHFGITVYDDKLKGKKYNLTSADSFRYVNEAFGKFVSDLAEEMK